MSRLMIPGTLGKDHLGDPALPDSKITLPALVSGAAGTMLLAALAGQRQMIIAPERVSAAPNRPFLTIFILLLGPALSLLLCKLGLHLLLGSKPFTAADYRQIRRLTLSSLGGSLLALGAFALLISGSFDTQYTTGYSPAAFKAVAIGDSEAEVVKYLGRPARVIEWEPEQPPFEEDAHRIYSYSYSPSSANYHLRQIWFDAHDRVVVIKSEIYWD